MKAVNKEVLSSAAEYRICSRWNDAADSTSLWWQHSV